MLVGNTPQPPADRGLAALVGRCPTPCYVYDLDGAVERVHRLKAAFLGRFGVSYAVKANPNRALLAALAPHVDGFDVSAFAEAERVLPLAGGKPLSFCGPGKRDAELTRFASLNVGHLVLESLDEATTLARLVHDQALPPQHVLLRVNPLEVPRGFGASMSGKHSQFGVDEEDAAAVIAAIAELPGLTLVGFHCYAATNCLKAAVLAENFRLVEALFRRLTTAAGIRPELLIFGAGFGVPYFAGETELDIDAVAAAAVPLADAMRDDRTFSDCRLMLELGRWIVAPAGTLLTGVIRAKSSRGTELRILDAGFNAHMAACGMLGGAFRRTWPIANLTNPDGAAETVDLVGPLCTTLDHVATGVTLPAARKGDVLAIGMSGAYGLTASPTRFISHPEPAEFVLERGALRDATESRLNHWSPAA